MSKILIVFNITHFQLISESSGRTKNNKLTYAYKSGLEFASSNPGISLHTSAHTLTLNSHR